MRAWLMQLERGRMMNRPQVPSDSINAAMTGVVAITLSNVLCSSHRAEVCERHMVIHSAPIAMNSDPLLLRIIVRALFSISCG